ncbi:hypothetical protein ABZS66_56725, partial [Dactylosporangium sp. NPDC005572]|uniref:hypothetical protein n=1 Tax=Dactylosporangium sp. NPDC005572 TaxID=3156889 RepID=UPI00339E30DF
GAQALAGTGGPAPQPAPTTTVDEPPYLDEPLTDWTRRIIDAPVRGNAAAEPGVVDELTAALLAARDAWPVKTELDRVKVLFVADTDGQRSFGAVFHDGTRAQFVASYAPEDVPVATLATGQHGGRETGGLAPLTLFGVNRSGFTVAIVPPGCSAERSTATQVGPDSTLQHTWAAGGEYLVLPDPRVWLRVTCGGTLRELADRALIGDPFRKIEPTPAERGEDLPDIARVLLRRWPTVPGLDVQRYRILWGGTPPGEHRPVVVGLGELGDGSVLVSAVAGTGDAMPVTAVHGAVPQQPPKDFPTARMTTAVAASDAMVTVRLPDEERIGYSERLLVIAPPGATRLRVTGGPVATVTLTDGVGVLTAPAPATLTIEALDADGRTLATQTVAEPRTERFLAGQGLVSEWG